MAITISARINGTVKIVDETSSEILKQILLGTDTSTITKWTEGRQLVINGSNFVIPFGGIGQAKFIYISARGTSSKNPETITATITDVTNTTTTRELTDLLLSLQGYVVANQKITAITIAAQAGAGAEVTYLIGGDA